MFLIHVYTTQANRLLIEAMQRGVVLSDFWFMRCDISALETLHRVRLKSVRKVWPISGVWAPPNDDNRAMIQAYNLRDSGHWTMVDKQPRTHVQRLRDTQCWQWFSSSICDCYTSDGYYTVSWTTRAIFPRDAKTGRKKTTTRREANPPVSRQLLTRRAFSRDSAYFPTDLNEFPKFNRLNHRFSSVSKAHQTHAVANYRIDFDAPASTWVPMPSRRPVVTFTLPPECNQVISTN